MRLSEFREFLSDEFGPDYGAVIARDLVLGELQDLTGDAALEAGIEPKLVWLAICRATDVPPERWNGKLKPKKVVE